MTASSFEARKGSHLRMTLSPAVTLRCAHFLRASKGDGITGVATDDHTARRQNRPRIWHARPHLLDQALAPRRHGRCAALDPDGGDRSEAEPDELSAGCAVGDHVDCPLGENRSTRPAAYTATVRRKAATSSHFRNHREPQTHAHPNGLAGITFLEPLIFVLALPVLAWPQRGAPPPAPLAPRRRTHRVRRTAARARARRTGRWQNPSSGS